MDTVADFITKIRNASRARHDKVDIPGSNLRRGIAEVLKDQGYIRDYKFVKDDKQGVMRLYLKYAKDGSPLIEEIQRVSRPGLRVYSKANEMPEVRSGYGTAVISTSKGVMSAKKATNQKVGGEVLIKVW